MWNLFRESYSINKPKCIRPINGLLFEGVKSGIATISGHRITVVSIFFLQYIWPFLVKWAMQTLESLLLYFFFLSESM